MNPESLLPLPPTLSKAQRDLELELPSAITPVRGLLLSAAVCTASVNDSTKYTSFNSTRLTHAHAQ